MRTITLMGIAAAALLTGVVGGYRFGTGAWPRFHSLVQSAEKSLTSLERGEQPGRKVLYWKDPDWKPNYSATPAKTAEGRAYVAVYDDQEPDFLESKPAPTAAAKGGARKILYYRNPMGLPDTSPVPKKDWMGMDYIPVYEGEDDGGSTVKVSLDRVQRSGVRVESVEQRRLMRPVRAPGVAKVDERTLRVVTLRADGFIEKLYVNELGKHVKAGDRLFRVYSPQAVRAQVDYRISAGERGVRGREQDLTGAEQRLRNLDLPDSAVEELKRTGQPVMSIDWPAPTSGVVLEKKVIEGQMAKAGDELFRIGDLTRIWVIADVAESDIGQLRVGAPAKVTFRAFPQEIFNGRVTFILHELEMKTRTAKVRVEVANPEHRIRHEMYADVEIDAGAEDAPRVAVPTSAVIDSGTRQVVIVERGEGLFEPRQVKLGLRGDGYVEVKEGVKAGEKVVVAANFLIDAESNLKAALKGFSPDAKTAPAEPRAEAGSETKNERTPRPAPDVKAKR